MLTGSSTVQDADIRRAVESLNGFALSLYAQLAAGQAGNFLFSPSSIAYALAMTYAGASDETARELAAALQLDVDPDHVHETLRELTARTKTGGIELRVANRLWGQRGYAFLEPYLALTERCYGARLAEVDFEHEPELVRQTINAWVAEQTAGRIDRLIAPGAFAGGFPTRLVITNATYFLGTWDAKFDEELTRPRPFWHATGESAPAAMMAQRSIFKYGELPECQILELPYQSSHFVLVQEEDGSCDLRELPDAGSDFGMCVILPREIVGLSAVESALSQETLRKLDSLKHEDVNLQFPRQRIESSFSLAPTLQALGISRAFSLDAQFHKMSDHPEGLFVGDVVHKAFVKVNERGTEAAASTGMMMFGGSAGPTSPPKEFVADHPFVFLIRDRVTGLIHFMGRCAHPGQCAD